MKHLVALLCGIINIGSSLADTLELTDGTLLNGNYMGGTSGTIRFETSGRVDVYPVSGILALTISRRGGSQAQPPKANEAAVQTTQSAASLSGGAHVVQAGTEVVIKLRSELSTASARSGQKFDAILESELRAGSVIIAPRGSIVKGTVTEVRRPRRIVKVATLGLTLDEVNVGDRTIRLSTNNRKTETHPDGSLVRGAVAGAIIGEVVDNDAGHGAAAGASLGALKRGDDIAYPAGSLLSFKLESPIKIAP